MEQEEIKYEPTFENLSVITFLWHEEGKEKEYLPEHVNRLADMVREHLSYPHRFICITDEKEGFADNVELFQLSEEVAWIKEVKTPEKSRLPSSYRRLWLFSEEAKQLGDRILMLDIDCLILKSLDPLFDISNDFIGWRPRSEFRPNKKVRSKTGVKRIGGGTWLLRTGTHTHIWNDFSPEGIMNAREQGWRGSDQAWLSYNLAETCTVFPDELGIYHSQDGIKNWKEVPEDACIIHFNGKINPWNEEAQSREWFCKLIGVPYKPERWTYLKRKQRKRNRQELEKIQKKKITFILYWWNTWPNGDFDLGIKYIKNLVKGIKQYIPIDIEYKIVLFTDQYQIEIDDVEVRELKTPKDLKWNLKKMFMYSQEANLFGPCLCLDLDCIIVDDLSLVINTVINLKRRMLITCAGAYHRKRPGGSVIGFYPRNKLRNLLWLPLTINEQRSLIENKTKGSERKYLQDKLKRNLVFFWDKILSNRIASFKRDCKEGLPKNTSIIRFHGHPRPHEINIDWVKEVWK